MAMSMDYDCWQVWPLWAQHGYVLWTMIVGKCDYFEHSMAMSVNYDCWQVDPLNTARLSLMDYDYSFG